jgi:adenine deaminase
MSKTAAAVSKENTLRKLGAHLRWQFEKCGVDADRDASVIVVVEREEDRSNMISGFLRDFDAGSMRRNDASPHQIVVHGVRIAVIVREPA